MKTKYLSGHSILLSLRALLTLFFVVSSGLVEAQSSLNTFDSKALINPNTSIDGSIGDVVFLPVDEAYIINVLIEKDIEKKQRLRINWQIAEDYYLYRHSFKFLLTDDKNQAVDIETVIPTGLKKEDEYFGKVEVYYHNADVSLKDLPQKQQLTLSVTSQGCADAGLCYPPRTHFYQIDTESGTVNKISENPLNSTTAANLNDDIGINKQSESLPYMLLLALLGGMILNLMPCVFPVLSLKVLAFANDKDHSQALHGVTYTVGVVISFIIVATVLISLQAAGEAIGWGFHLQSPWFVSALAYLFFVLGLSLSGVIEFGGQWMNFGNRFASQSGYSGSFFTGILAAVVASPCTAPMMGTALGFAVTQPPVIAVSVFAALGLGMALPVLLLSCSPKLLKKIPKPGKWMEQFKQLLAFPLYATAVWLAWVVGKQTGVNGMAILLLGCVLIALAVWFWTTSNGTMTKILGALIAVASLTLLNSPFLTTDTGDDQPQNWTAYSPEILEKLREQGKPVFLNVTADWCITCLANEKVALDTETVQQALQNSGITYLKGDWTNHDPNITALLKEHRRNGIPLYLVYPSNQGEVQILPQILTSSILLEAFSAIL